MTPSGIEPRNLPACSAVPQPTTPPRAPRSVLGKVKLDIHPQYYTQLTFYDTFFLGPDYEGRLKTRSSNLRKF